MGAKKIEAKRKEYAAMVTQMSKIVEVIEKLTPVIQKYQDTGKEIETRFNDLAKKYGELLPVVEKLETGGIKEFEQYKAHLVGVCSQRSFGTRLLPTAPLKNAVEAKRKEVAKELNDWLDKLAAGLPKDFKKGMTFKDYGLGRIYELTSDPIPAKNENLKGDAAIFFSVDIFAIPEDDSPPNKIGSTQISKADMTKSGKLKLLKI